jgi:hypothetical protein
VHYSIEGAYFALESLGRILSDKRSLDKPVRANSGCVQLAESARAGLLFRVKVHRTGRMAESSAACKIGTVGRFFHISEAEKQEKFPH